MSTLRTIAIFILLAVLVTAGVVFGVNNAQAQTSTGTMYGVDPAASNLYTVDLSDGSWDLVGGTGTGSPIGLAWDSCNSVMYGLDTGNDSLYSVNLSTGTWTLIGDSGLIFSRTIGFDSANCVLYGSGDNNGTDLFIVNRTTGAWTVVDASEALLNSTVAMEYDEDTSAMYAIETDGTNSLYQINLANGSVVSSSALALTQGLTMSGLGYNTDTDVMYVASLTTDQTYWVNLRSGALTSVGTTGITTPSGMAFVPAAMGASDALTNLTQTKLDHESATYTLTVDTTMAPTVYYQYRETDASWPDSASSVTGAATTTISLTGLSADTGYELRVGIDDAFASGSVNATFSTSFFIERLLFGAKGGDLYELDRTTGGGGSNLVTGSSTQDDLWGLTQCGDALFALTRGPVPAAAIRIIDPSDWSMTTVATTNGFGVGENDPRSLACDESTLTLYFAGQTNDILYTLNPNIGEATRVGTSDNFGVAVDVRPNSMVVSNSTLYIGNSFNDDFYSTNTTTGAFITAVASLPSGNPNEQAHGMTTDGTTVWIATRRIPALFTWSAPNSTFTQVGSATNFGVSENEPRSLGFLKIPHTFSDVTAAASSSLTDTTATVTGTVSGSDTHSRNYYLRLKVSGEDYGATILKESTTGSAPSFDLTGLTASTSYVAEVGPNMAFPSDLSSTASFSTTAEYNAPSITPDPAGSDWMVATNQQFHTANTVGVMAVTISETGDGRTGDLTFHTTEAGLTCDTQTNSISVDTASHFWVRFCDEGTLTMKVVDNSESENVVEYAMTLVEQSNRAPVFTDDTATRSVNENVASGTNVGSPVTATDADDDTITYSISGSSLFSIVSTSGQIQVATNAQVNYEVATSHTVTVTASDEDSDEDTITVTINVGDLDDAPVLTPSPATTTTDLHTNVEFTVSLPSNAHPTQNVTVTATAGTGHMRLRATETGLDCDTTVTSLTVASVASFYARFCDDGTATLSVAPTGSSVDNRDYSVTITDPATVPGQPTSLSATPADSQMTLAWTAPNDGGADLTEYDFTTDGGTTWATTGSASASAVITQTSAATPAALVNGTEYQFAVRANNRKGHGTASATVNATPNEQATVPSQVTGVSARAGDGQVLLTWTAPSNGGSPITRYEYATFDTPPFFCNAGTDLEQNVTQTCVVGTGASLVNGTEYHFRVRAVNAEGNGAQSAAVTATPRAASVPGAPTSFIATAHVSIAGYSQVLLSWTAPTVAHDGTITDYEYSSNNGTSWRSIGSTLVAYTATQTSAATPVNFTLGTQYTFRVRAINSTGNGAQSASATATPYNAPSAPGNLQGSAGNAQVTLSWTAASANGRSITDYEYSSDNGTTWASTGTTGNSDTVTQTSAASPVNLVNGTSYTFRVRARNSLGAGPQSNSVSVTPTSSTVPGKVVGLTGSPGDGFMRLDWTAPDDGGTAIIRYEYDAYLVSPGTWLTTGGTDTTVTVTETTNGSYQMLNNQAFGFKVRAVNSIGHGPESDQLEATPANQPPAFSSDTATRSVDENEAVGTNVGAAFTASDPESNTITYSITGTNTGGFTVTSAGRIQTGQVLDREDTDSYTVNLRAAATGGNDNITVTITVNNVNEAPSYSEDSTTRSVPENSTGGTDVGLEVLAMDPDFGDSLAYTLYNGLSRFTIGSGTGQIQVASNANLDYEGTNSYDVTVRATDNAGLYDEISVTINITNEVEAARLAGLTVPSSGVNRTGATVEATLFNGDGASTTVYFRHRTPPNSGSWSATASEITSGTSVNHDITGLTENTTYEVEASLDSSFPNAGLEDEEFTTTANNAPAFSSSAVTRQVHENRLHGTAVGDPVTATDSDGDALTYTLGGTDAASFDIDDSTAQITVATGTDLDYETKESYSVTVTATDTFSATGSTTVTIEVLDIGEAGLLGRIIITVGSSGDNYGLDTGSYGTLDSGDFPGDLFTDGTARTVDEIYEDGDGNWYWTYSGGAADGWIDDQELLDEIQVTVTYEDGRNTRQFILGGFIEDRPGGRGLKLEPPIPSRDWDDWDGEDIAFDFRRHTSQSLPVILPMAVVDPPAVAGTWASLLNRTPGGPVGTQVMLTLLASAAVIFKARNSQDVLMAIAAMVLIPLAVAAFTNTGDWMMAGITTVCLGCGAMIDKAVLSKSAD